VTPVINGSHGEQRAPGARTAPFTIKHLISISYNIALILSTEGCGGELMGSFEGVLERGDSTYGRKSDHFSSLLTQARPRQGLARAV